ncbi:MAG: ribulose-phosphate 3-epimerase [Chloroflexi bacterium]|nr:ribulose-phosphate 3-epimerase [Chloroflexota bacterium]
MRVQIAPSVYACPLLRIGEAIDAVEAAGVDALHLDVMDGHFVPAISFGMLFVREMRARTSLPIDVHLMVAQPENLLDELVAIGVRGVTVHAEAFDGRPDGFRDLGEVLRTIRAAGMRAGIALKPGTPDTVFDAFAADIDDLLVMTVEPGASGQSFRADQVEKIRRISGRARPIGIEVAVDGGINPETGAACVSAGARYLVVGSALFAGGLDGVASAVSRMRGLDQP